MSSKSNEHWLDSPAHQRTLWRAFLGLLALTVLAEWVVALHPHFAVESIFGFHAAFGFLVCALMIVLAKALAVVLKRPDTYYDSRHD